MRKIIIFIFCMILLVSIVYAQEELCDADFECDGGLKCIDRICQNPENIIEETKEVGVSHVFVFTDFHDRVTYYKYNSDDGWKWSTDGKSYRQLSDVKREDNLQGFYHDITASIISEMKKADYYKGIDALGLNLLKNVGDRKQKSIEIFDNDRLIVALFRQDIEVVDSKVLAAQGVKSYGIIEPIIVAEGEVCLADFECDEGLKCIDRVCVVVETKLTEVVKEEEEAVRIETYGLFESIEGVLEKVNILMKLTVPFNSIDYSYRMVVEQTYDNKIGIKALFDEAILYRRLAEMKNNYERVGPKELEREKIKRVPVKEPPKPKEPITAEPAPAAPIEHDEEFDIYGKEITLNLNELVDLDTGINLGLHESEEVLDYKNDGEYIIYLDSFLDDKYKFVYINVEGGIVIDTEEVGLKDEGEEAAFGLFKILLLKSEGERITVNVLNVEDLAEMEVDEEIIPPAEREGNIEDLKDVPYDAIVRFIEDNGLNLEDVEYMTRILSIERGEACDPKWNKERGAIAQVVINRRYSGAFPTTVKDVVRADLIPRAARWFGKPNSEIDNEDRGIKSMNSRGCVLSVLRFFMCQGEEDAGAKMIGGRTGFTHRFRLKDIPEWNKINPIQVQNERDAATFSGDDTSDKECSLRNYRGTGLVADVKKLEGLCFPLERESFDKSLNDWGNNRGPKRCHAGIDLLTKNPGKVMVADNGVIAIDDGVVTNIFGFTSCKDGWSGPGKVIALLIYHPNLGKTVNYGEIDKDGLAPNIKVGDKITRGQYLGRAGHCGMLHLELYKGQQVKNIRWFPPSGSVATGYRNKCAKEFLSTKPVALEDPSNFVKALDFCPSSEPLV